MNQQKTLDDDHIIMISLWDFDLDSDVHKRGPNTHSPVNEQVRMKPHCTTKILKWSKYTPRKK